MRKYLINGQDSCKVSLDNNCEHIIIHKNGGKINEVNFKERGISLTVKANELQVKESAPSTNGRVKINATKGVNLSVELFDFPGGYSENALVVGIDDMRTGRSINAFSLDDCLINIHKEGDYIVIEKGEVVS